jgi:hypothetical protein
MAAPGRTAKARSLRSFASRFMIRVVIGLVLLVVVVLPLIGRR